MKFYSEQWTGKFFLIGFFLCLAFSTALAQRTTSQPVSPAAKVKKEPRTGKTELSNEAQQSLIRLQILSTQARKLDPSILKVKVLAKVADTLWTFDEPSSRKLFTEAFEAINSLQSVNDRSQPAPADEPTSAGFLLGLRANVLQLVAARDFKLAESLRQSLPEQAPDRKNSRTDLAEKDELAWETAIASASSQPAVTAKFVRTALTRGISEDFIWGLAAIRQRNQQLADQLFNETLSLVRSDLAAKQNIGILALYVLPIEQPGPQLLALPPTAETIVRSYLSYVADALAWPYPSINTTSDDADQLGEYRMLLQLFPLFERHLPERLPTIQARIDALLPGVTENSGAGSKQVDIDELLHDAEATVGSVNRDRKLAQVSLVALRGGEIERALNIADRISDLGQRNLQISRVAHHASLGFLKQGDVENAYKWARKIDFLPLRVAVFVTLATRLKDTKDETRARVILDEICDWTTRAPTSPHKARALLTLVGEMMPYDSERSFDLMTAAVRTINAADFSARASNEPSIVARVPLEALDFEGIFSMLSRVNNDRVLQLADSLTQKDASLFAQAIVSATILTTNKTRSSKTPN